MSESKEYLALGQAIIDRWLDNGGIASQEAMLEAKRGLTEWLAKTDTTEVEHDWPANQDIFALWCLIEIELEQCPPKGLRDLVFSMRGKHQLWFGRLIFSLAIYLYESETTPQIQEGVRLIQLHAVIWAEIMLLHSVLSAYDYKPEPEKFMSVEFGLADYQKLDKRLKSSSSSKLPGVSRLLEELMGYGDPVAEFLLGMDEDYDSDLIRDASDCGFVLASYYGALKAGNAKAEDFSAYTRILNKKEEEMLLKRITIESVGKYLGKHEDTLNGFSSFGLTEHPACITNEDWVFFGGLVHHARERRGNPKPGTPASGFWLEAERKFDDHLGNHVDSSLYAMNFPSNKLLQFIKEQYELVKRCKYRLQLAKPIVGQREEYLASLVVESAKLFEALLKACVICFNEHSNNKRINKVYVGRYNRCDERICKQTSPYIDKNIPEKIELENQSGWKRGRDHVIYAQSGQDDFIAKNCKSPALNDYIFEVLHPLRGKQKNATLKAMEWGYGVLMTYWEPDEVLINSCNVRSLLCTIALTAFVYPDHPFRSLWRPDKKDGLKSLIEEAYALYVLRNKSGGAHFSGFELGIEEVLEQANKVFTLADMVIGEVLIDIERPSRTSCVVTA